MCCRCSFVDQLADSFPFYRSTRFHGLSQKHVLEIQAKEVSESSLLISKTTRRRNKRSCLALCTYLIRCPLNGDFCGNRDDDLARSTSLLLRLSFCHGHDGFVQASPIATTLLIFQLQLRRLRTYCLDGREDERVVCRRHLKHGLLSA